jgi:kumamolisin
MIFKKYLTLSSVVAVVCCGLTVAANAESFQTRHVFDVVAKGQVQMVGHLPSSQIMQLDVMLPVNDAKALEDFATAVSDPKSKSYRKFMTPDEFSATFGPSHQDYDATLRYLQSYGLTVVGGSWQQMDIQVKGPVSAIEAAFNVQMNNYQHPTENRTFYSPDREPTTNLPVALWHVSGLDNFSIPKPKLARRSEIAAARGITPEEVSPMATTGSGPGHSYLGSDMSYAYFENYNRTTYQGQGQNLGLFEYVGTNLTDLHTYYHNVGQTLNVPVTLYSTDGTPVQCIYTKYDHWCDDTEQTLDMTQALGMAPELSNLTMYVGSTDSAIIGAMTVHSPLPMTIGCSWGWYPVDPSTLNPLFERMAAQGQSFFVAAGDSGNWADSGYVWPADNAWVISVGGTDLVTTGPAGYWASESAWEYGGGGVSVDGVSIPTYQSAPGGSSTLEVEVVNSNNHASGTYRNGPDVAANANFTFYVCADMSPCTENDYGGTSFAAPMWAGAMALINQAQAVTHQVPVGFINPTLYFYGSLYFYEEPSEYSNYMHDITTGAQYNGYSAITGYDLATGWGTPTIKICYFFGDCG